MSRPTQGRINFLPVRGYHPLWPSFPTRSRSYLYATGLVRVRSSLLTESRLMSFPPGTEIFQFPGFASCTYVFSTGYLKKRWVFPFGYPRIKDYWHLPTASRSLSRPSSPAIAKASTKCPYSTCLTSQIISTKQNIRYSAPSLTMSIYRKIQKQKNPQIPQCSKRRNAQSRMVFLNHISFTVNG